MKNNDLKDLKPIYIEQAHYSAEDEISLLDLVKVLVRRKIMIAIIISLAIALGVFTALLTTKSYTYSTSIEIGSQVIAGAIKPFQSAQTLLAKIQYVFIPQVLNEQRTDTEESVEKSKKYKLKASIPKNSTLIVLEIQGVEDKAVLMTQLLQNVTQLAIQDHQRINDAIKQNLLALIEQAKTQLAALDSEKNSKTEQRLLKSNIETHKTDLANLQNTREVLSPMKSLEATGTSRKLIVIIAVFTGVFLAVFFAFFAEFVTKGSLKNKFTFLTFHSLIMAALFVS